MSTSRLRQRSIVSVLLALLLVGCAHYTARPLVVAPPLASRVDAMDVLFHPVP